MPPDAPVSGKSASQASSENRQTGPCLDPACTPEGIEARSFAIIDAEFSERPFSGHAWEIARRLIHTTGDPSIAESLSLPEQAIASGVKAIRSGASIFTDTEMVRAGIPMRRLKPFSNRVECILAQEGLAEAASLKGCTRTRAGMEALGSRMGGAIIAIGNAPTALLALLDIVRATNVPPTLVIGMPVGFVNAAESKELLLSSGLPSLVLRGRRGGSPLAAATVNALAVIAGQSV